MMSVIDVLSRTPECSTDRMSPFSVSFTPPTSVQAPGHFTLRPVSWNRPVFGLPLSAVHEPPKLMILNVWNVDRPTPVNARSNSTSVDTSHRRP
eukprot:CAMPEP_0178385804 /NCGR_PEP_ID=MMETSP0689_2-20121128/8219_1 /TAXON_ID=160604 /ORGANISM="Amphidinium massartii, Strain CS-259" /LENGTH=93 /DNA_ID=CAMNT_0020006093 /DNA_START=33 /DNA_END=310 /DNA_ORIENTATION=-